MINAARTARKSAIKDTKRAIILEAAFKVFEKEGLEGANMRAIGEAAGYTAAAIYFHFPSKESIYAELLSLSLDRLIEHVDAAVTNMKEPRARFEAASLAFFDFYARHPRDLDLGFYLFRGGMQPRGISREANATLNAKLARALREVGAAARELGAGSRAVQQLEADVFAHAAGLLLMEHTGRIKMFGAHSRRLMETHIARLLAQIEGY